MALMTTVVISAWIAGFVFACVHVLSWAYMAVWFGMHAGPMIARGEVPALDNRTIKAITILLGSGALWGLCAIIIGWAGSQL